MNCVINNAASTVGGGSTTSGNGAFHPNSL